MSAMTWTSCPTRPAPRVRSARPASPGSPVRLTRRGRLVVLALLLGLGFGLLLVATAPATATSDPGSTAIADRVTVQPGDTLWAIAERVRPDADPRATVDRIRDMNGLDSGVAQAGQVLLVPAAG